MDKKGPEKKAQLLAALEKGMVMIHLDARRPGVLVPPSLRNESHLRLNLSYRFDPPDLTVGEWGVRCTLSFSGSRFKVAVPWSALYAISSHVTREFWMYPEDMPRELLEQPQVPPTLRHEPRLGEPARGGLREVVSNTDPKEPKPPDEPPRPSGRGHLRLVK